MQRGEFHLSTKDWIGFIGMVVGMFMSILDIQIVNSSLQQIQAGLSATTEEITWIQTSYLIAEVIMIPLSGWLARAFSTRYLYFVSCAWFTAMSLACAFAWDLNSMIVFRAFQGFFGGAMIPTVFALIYTMFPMKMRPMLTIIVGLVVTIAPTAGPIVGGYLTENISWHAMFLINILPGILVCFTTWNFVKVDQPEWDLLKKIDYPGIILIIIFLGSLEYVLEEGTQKEWFDSVEITVMMAVAVVAGVATIYRELTCAHPIVELRAFKDRNFCFGSIFSFIIGWGLFAGVYLMPLYLGMIKGLNSLQIGTYVMVTGLFQFFSAPIAANLSKVMDLRIMLAIGLSIYGLGLWLDAFITAEWGYWEFFLPQALRGLSLMLCFLPINTIALGTLPVDKIKNASGLYNLMRNLGGAIGLAIVNTWQQRWMKGHYADLRESVSFSSPHLSQVLEGFQAKLESITNASPHTAAIKILTQLAQREAMILTFNDLFFALSGLFFLSLLLIFFLKKVDPNKSNTSEAH